jgi:DNA-directed RNA polymerase specialized sigma24 family protein
LVERKELYEVLLGCVKKLPDRLRSAVAAYYFDKKGSCADCAELLGIKLNTMEQRLSRARQALKECVRRRVGR